MEKRKNYTINLFRFIFAVAVFGLHSMEYIPYCWHGDSSVEFFFLISGYFTVDSANKYLNSNDISVLESSINFFFKKLKTFFLPCVIAKIIGFILYRIVNKSSLIDIIFDLLSFPFEVLLTRGLGFTSKWYIGVDWYLSAMMIVIFICFPLLLKYNKKYRYYFAPIISLSILGYLAHTYGTLTDISVWSNFILKSTLRAFAVMNLGIVLHNIVDFLNQFNFNKLGKIKLLIIEIISFFIPVYFAFFVTTVNLEFQSLFFISVAIIISFLDVTFFDKFFDKHHIISEKLGEYSLYLYIFHRIILNYIMPIVKNYIYDTKLLRVFFLLSVFIGSAIFMYICKLINKQLPKIKKLWID